MLKILFFFKLLSRSRFPLVRLNFRGLQLDLLWSSGQWGISCVCRRSWDVNWAKREQRDMDWRRNGWRVLSMRSAVALLALTPCQMLRQDTGSRVKSWGPTTCTSTWSIEFGGTLVWKRKAPEVQGPWEEGYHIFVTNLLTSIQAQPVQICFSFHPEKLQSVRLSSHCFMFVWLLKYLDRAQQPRQQGPASGGQLGLNPTSQCRHDMEYHESRGASHVSWGHVFSGHQINRHEPDSWLLDQKMWYIDSRWLKVFC